MKTNENFSLESLKQENLILSKISLETVLRYLGYNWNGIIYHMIGSTNDSEEWKEKTGFSVSQDGTISWNHYDDGIKTLKPAEIFKKIEEEKEQLFIETEANLFALESLTEENIKQAIKLEEQKEEIKKLKKWKEYAEYLKKELKDAWSEGETHLGAAKIAGEIAEKKFLAERENFKEKLNDEQEKFQQVIEWLAKEKIVTQKLQMESEEKSKKISEIREELAGERKQKRELYFANKPLPKTPSTFKLFKKMKIKFQQLMQRKIFKSKKQELFAQIETK